MIALTRYSKIAIDTSPFIYLVEEDEAFGSAARDLFSTVEQGPCVALTSILTMTELLVQPYRNSDMNLRGQYLDFLMQFPNLQFYDMDLAVADRAAELRARYSLKTSDAIQIATALTHGAELFVTNDQKLNRVGGEIDVLLLSSISAG